MGRDSRSTQNRWYPRLPMLAHHEPFVSPPAPPPCSDVSTDDALPVPPALPAPVSPCTGTDPAPGCTNTLDTPAVLGTFAAVQGTSAAVPGTSAVGTGTAAAEGSHHTHSSDMDCLLSSAVSRVAWSGLHLGRCRKRAPWSRNCVGALSAYVSAGVHGR